MDDFSEALKALAEHEAALKKSLPFREWLQHIIKSHDQIVTMIREGPAFRDRMRVEVLVPGKASIDGFAYSVESSCRRIVVDTTQRGDPQVRGFSPGDDSRQTQFIEKFDGAGLA